MRLPAEDAFKLGARAVGTSVPVAVVALELGRYRGAGDLLSACVAATLVLNPVLGELSRQGGGRADDTAFSARAGTPLAEVATELVPGRRGRRPVLQPSGRGRWRLWAPDDHQLAGVPLAPGATVQLTAHQALAVVTAARAARIPVVERGRAGRLGRCLDDAMAVEVATSGRGPGLVEVRRGDGGHLELTAGELLERFDGEAAPTLVVDAEAADAAVCAAAAPRGRAGLREVQDLFVERYTGVDRGMVLALAPGCGKTVCAAAALAELWSSGRGRTTVCAVPARLVEQWRGELDRWFPDAAVADLDSWASVPGDRPLVVLDSVDRVARRAADGSLEDLVARGIDDLVVDEANLLSTGSQRARSLWELRRVARRALALTGTVAQGGDGPAARLVAWALDHAGTGGNGSGNGSVDVSGLDRWAGPFLLGDDGAGALPEVRREVVAHDGAGADPGPLVEVWHQLQAAGRGGLDDEGRRLRAEAGRLRLALLEELEALRRTEALASADAVAHEVAREVARGGAGLVFCDTTAVAVAQLRALAGAGVAAEVLDGERAASRFAAGELAALVVTPAGQRGFNLQRATLVAHADVPVRAGQARQRLGRAVRIGGADEVLELYVCSASGPFAEVCHQLRDGVELRPTEAAALVVASQPG